MKKLLTLVLVFAICLCSFTLAKAESSTDGKKEIVLWNQIFEDWNRAWCEERVAEFNSDPNQKYYITQVFIDGSAWDEKIAAARAAGTMPDIYLENYADLTWGVTNGYFMPLDNLISKGAWDDLYDNKIGRAHV